MMTSSEKIAVGVAESRADSRLKVLFQVWRGAGGWKRDDRFRVFPVPCDLRFIDLSPEEFREKYRTLVREKVKKKAGETLTHEHDSPKT